DIKANSVALDKTSMQITSQNSINKLVATVTPTQANQKVSWSSSNGNIAKVDSKGRVTPVSNGTCKIIATTTDGTNRTASCDVTVDVKFVTGISFDFNSYTITNVNQTPVFNPNITPSDAEDKSVRWSSSNTKVATVSSSGVIKVAGNGTCKITATTTDGTNLSASFNITVNIKSAKITLDKTKIELTTGKETEKITSSIEPSIANKNVKYTSSDESIATVSSDGVVTAVGSGTCKITAAPTDGSKVTASCDVTVDIKTTGMKLDKTNYTFNKAETIKINPVVTPSKASKKLTWTSSNTKVAIVSSDGKVTPVGKGTCKITATTTDGTNLSSSCNITSNVEYQKGDVNRDGKVNTLDVYYAMKGIVNGTLTDEEKVILDVNGDSKANTLDINIIMRYIVGQIDSL
ncbi:MAG: Ig domain-containing protein, partial [Christensenellales bacterium]